MAMFGIFLLVTAWSLVHCNTNAFRKFGCNFDNEKLELHTELPEDIVLGEKELQVMAFDYEADFNKLLEIMMEANKKLLGEFIYNEVTEMQAFLGAYNEHTSSKRRPINLVDFYKTYHPLPKLTSTSHSMVLSLFNTIVAQEPRLEDFFYFIPAGKNIPSALMERVYNESDVGYSRVEDLIWPYGYHNHVAGFFRMSVGSRRGFVLLDPGMGLERPIVVMQDGQSPHFDKALGNSANSKRTTFKFTLAKDLPYILAQTGPSVRSDQAFYYFRKPYCSFLDTTVKPGLTEPWHRIEKRGPTGMLEAQMKMMLYDPSGDPPSDDTTTNTGQVKVTLTGYNKKGESVIQVTIGCSPNDCDLANAKETRDAFKFVRDRLNAAFPNDNLINTIQSAVKSALEPGVTRALYDIYQHLVGDPAADNEGNVGKCVRRGKETRFEPQVPRSMLTSLLPGAVSGYFRDPKEEHVRAERLYGPLKRMSEDCA